MAKALGSAVARNEECFQTVEGEIETGTKIQRWIVEPGDRGMCEGSHTGMSGQYGLEVLYTARLQCAG